MKICDETQSKIKSQLRRGILDFIVLAGIEKKAKYPREIIEELSRSGLEIVEGTLYPLFLRLKKQGWVDHVWDDSGGHPRKYYSLTKEGVAVLKVYKEEWKQLENIINTIK